jgi:glycosyltransferase involved in cell wall biosynthesis
MPAAKTNGKPKGKKILFPASALGRKGAYEIKRLAKELDLSIIYTGNILENRDFWKGIKAERAGNNLFDDVCLVVSPTYVEHQPRLLLKALSNGIPVVTTTASGLTPSENITIVNIGDFEELKQAVYSKLKTRLQNV